MRITIDNFSFEIPPAFVDVTDYTFQTRDQREQLTVTFGTRPPQATDLPSLLDLRKAEVENVLGPPVTLGEDSDTRLDGLPARMTWFRFEDRGTTYESSFAVALPTPDEYVQISYAYHATDNQARPRFQHILRSVVPARRQIAQPTASGYVRRWANRMTLEVPATLAPPKVMQFQSANGEILVVLSPLSGPTPASAPPAQAADMARDAAAGVISDQATRSLDTAAAKTSVMSYVLTSQSSSGKSQEAVRRAASTVNEGPVVNIEARAPLARAAELDSVLSRLVQSFTREK